jgi:hypothetical protein
MDIHCELFMKLLVFRHVALNDMTDEGSDLGLILILSQHCLNGVRKNQEKLSVANVPIGNRTERLKNTLLLRQRA